MNRLSFKLVSFLVSLAALTVVSSSMSARAEMTNQHSASTSSESRAASVQPAEPAHSITNVEPLATNSATASTPSESRAAAVQPIATTQSLAIDPLTTNSAASMPSSSAATPVQPTEPAVTRTTITPLATNPLIPEVSQDTPSQVNVQPASLTDINNYHADSQQRQPQAVNNQQPAANRMPGKTVATPIPGTAKTSAAALSASETASTPGASSLQPDNSVAQTNTNTTIEPGRATRGGSSYIGVGGNIGLGGGSALGDGAFAITSKIGLTRTFSFRPAAIIGDETAFLLPITYDFVIESGDPFSPVPFAPYLGGGVAVTTEGDVGFLLTGGVDVPLSREFVANGAINVDFGDDTNVGLFLGVGYTFPDLFRR